MVDTSQLLIGSLGLLALTACTPHDRAVLEIDEPIEHRAKLVDTLLAPANARVDEGDNREALDELMTAAELAANAELDEAQRCDFATGAAAFADELIHDGAYAEARMAYAVAIQFSRDCAGEVRSELTARRDDARATQQWAMASS